MVRYKLVQHPVLDIFEVYEVKSEFYTEPKKLENSVSHTTMSTLLGYLLLHATRTNQSLDSSVIQLSAELKENFDSYVSMLNKTKEEL